MMGMHFDTRCKRKEPAMKLVATVTREITKQQYVVFKCVIKVVRLQVAKDAEEARCGRPPIWGEELIGACMHTIAEVLRLPVEDVHDRLG